MFIDDDCLGDDLICGKGLSVFFSNHSMAWECILHSLKHMSVRSPSAVCTAAAMLKSPQLFSSLCCWNGIAQPYRMQVRESCLGGRQKHLGYDNWGVIMSGESSHPLTWDGYPRKAQVH